MNHIIQKMKQLPSISAWLGGLEQEKSQLVLGLSGSAKHMAQAAVYESFPGVTVIVTSGILQATHVYEELVSWYGEDTVYLFSAEEALAAEMAYTSPEIKSQRIEALNFLREGKKGMLVVPLAALRKRLVPVEVWDACALEFRVGQELSSIDELLSHLLDMGYKRTSKVSSPGEIAVRGGIVDIYPLNEEHPLRLDFFDTELDSIRLFDVETQRSMDVLERAVVLPATECPLSKQDLFLAREKINQLFEEEIEKTEDKDHRLALQHRYQLVKTQLEKGEVPSNMQAWMEVIYPATTVLDYCPQKTYLLIDDYAQILEKERNLELEDAQWVLHKASQGEIPAHFHITVGVRNQLKEWQKPHTFFSMFQKGMGNLKFTAIHPISYRTMTQFFSQMPLIKSETERWVKQALTAIVVVSDLQRAKKLEQNFDDFGIEVIISPTNQIQEHRLQIVVGELQSGFELPKERWLFVSEKELFNRVIKKAPKALKISNAERLKNYSELSLGDYVVHVNHGIGQYKGMQTLEIKGIHKDYLSISYADGGNLFVPIDQIHLVQKYVASEGKEPSINKLGTADWSKSKRKVAAKIEDIADELIELYAKRDSEKGFAFSKDTPEQKEFEDSFPYVETADQLRASQEIKKDMEKEKPMDRLLIGDVGYGKTEVAMRAAFKALSDGKQVAVLVPTTILAEQHYETFTARFADYPFQVGLLSRFRTKREQVETIEEIRKGKIDLVIGTHRILSKDVQFLDLGLLVVDEEQRFGVKHKERLKQLKSQVDVLTLTATPIPRTLHMSMLGVRDLSVIETPPVNRYPVQTYVIEQDGLTIRDGIERELARGGQVFYLYNRVETIERKADELRALVPEARVAVVHGQMTESSMENILYQFIEGEYDVLVTTTIIETGVDIPNVNTLFIENADRMGLSQLYQLRGRVGRTNRLAYAYLMYQPNKVLSEVGEKRLQSMKDYTELGSGFKIAMRDLSIRGAGNLLGKQQHGFIDSVGFDLYSQMLSEAIARKRGESSSVDETQEVEIDLDIDVYLPSNYIQDERQKIEFYKRIRSLASEEEYHEILEDLIDRFGEFPDEVADLVEVGMIKKYGEEAGVSKIQRDQNSLYIFFSEKSSSILRGLPIFEALGSIKLPAQVKERDKKVQILLNCSRKSQDQWLREIKVFLGSCNQIVNKVEKVEE